MDLALLRKVELLGIEDKAPHRPNTRGEVDLLSLDRRMAGDGRAEQGSDVGKVPFA